MIRRNFLAPIVLTVLLVVILFAILALTTIGMAVNRGDHETYARPTSSVSVVTKTNTLTVPVAITTTKVVTVTRIQTNTVEVAQPTWIPLSGEWTLTYYGENDEAEGARTGASWNGYSCPDWQNYYRYGLQAAIPSNVDQIHYGIAMPGAEFYCLPVKVCNIDKCAIGVAVDVPADYVIDGYLHADLWPAMAEELGVTEPVGIVKGGVKVYVGNGVK